MSIPFTCPHCGLTTSVDDKHAGRTGPCAACGGTITIPDASAPPCKKSKASSLVIVIILIALVFGGGTLFFKLAPAFRYANNEPQRLQCKNNIRNLSLAVLVTESRLNAFPPAAGPIRTHGAGASDSPTAVAPDWSWRVRILPELEQRALFEQFHFDEPWDSEHNLTVAENMPNLFQCPSDESGFKEVRGHKIPVTNYVMVSGANAVGTVDGSSVGLEHLVQADGASNTLLIVEVTGDDRPAWTEPVDVTLEDLARGINSESGRSIGSRHPGDVNVGFCDGTVESISNDVAGEELVFMGHWRDGNIVDREKY